MRAVGDKKTGTIRPDFDRSISIDFHGAKITTDTGFLLMREIDRRFDFLRRVASQIEDPRSTRHTDHSMLQLLLQRFYQAASGYEDSNDRLAGGWAGCGVFARASPILWGWGTKPSTAGKEVCREIAKTGLIDLSLACSIAKL
jgi:hypothetical protein